MNATTKYGRWSECYALSLIDVGRPTLRIFGRTWRVSDFIGEITRQDVGKRVYLVDGVLQVENDEQRAAREGYDTTSSASRQHYIDTGHYLREGESL